MGYTSQTQFDDPNQSKHFLQYAPCMCLLLNNLCVVLRQNTPQQKQVQSVDVT